MNDLGSNTYHIYLKIGVAYDSNLISHVKQVVLVHYCHREPYVLSNKERSPLEPHHVFICPLGMEII